MNETAERKILPGQIWRDKDPRYSERLITVEKVDQENGYAYVTTSKGVKSRIKLDRLPKAFEYQKQRRLRVRRNTIKDLMNSMLGTADRAGQLDEIRFEDVMGIVKEKFPESKFNPGHFSWYKTKFRIAKSKASEEKAPSVAEPPASA